MSASSVAHAPRYRKRYAVLLLTAAVLIAVGAIPRLLAHRNALKQRDVLEKPTVSVVHPTPDARTSTIVLPADVQAYQQTPIYARTNGYLNHWYADIGTPVKSGDLLAVIDAPEVDAELLQARADAANAQAAYQISKITAQRWKQLLTTNSVSRQSAQQNISTMEAKKAALAAADANVLRLTQLQSYEKVYAPFSGTITRRNIDTGALIDAGSNGGPHTALFDLAETDKLRVYVEVPQDAAPEIAVGATAQLTLPQFPGRSFPGRVARTAGAIDPASRTLLVEVDVDNRDGSILPGAYAQVHLDLASHGTELSLPANTLLFRPSGVTVAVVNAQDKVQLKTITLGRDLGTRIEVSSGLLPTDAVIVNPSDSISAGQAVNEAAPHGKES